MTDSPAIAEAIRKGCRDPRCTHPICEGNKVLPCPTATMIRAAIVSYIEQTGTDGWVMVPREPTEEMCAAGDRAIKEAWRPGNSTIRQEAVAAYRAMLAAAGEPK